MAHTLLENVNGEYYRNQSILTGKPNRIKVIVEDEADVAFWFDILNFVKPDKDFSVSPYSYAIPENTEAISLETGKEHILSKARANELNAYYIGCIDSDYDYLLQNYREDGKLMQCNPYLLQTYAYSIENLLCYAETLKPLCSKSVKEVPDFDFVDYLQKVSQIVRPLFVRVLYLAAKGYEDFTATDWKSVFPCDEQVHSDTQAEKNILPRLQHNVDEYIRKIDFCHKEITKSLALFEAEIFSGNTSVAALISDACYLGVRGHDMYRFVLNTALKGVAKQLKSRHLDNLKNAEASDAEKKNRIAHYQKEVINIESLLKTNYEFKHHCPIFKTIAYDVHQIWKPV